VVATGGQTLDDLGEGVDLGEVGISVAPAELRVRDLLLTFGSVEVLQGVDLDVRPGELLALVGRNGSGKTTLLRCLIGLTRPQGGQISVQGRSIVGRPVGETARTIGYVPQAPSSMLFADSVEDEIALTLRNRGYAASPGAATPWLEAFGLSSLAARYPRDLSAGERQRVALAAVLSGRPSIVLLDEPTLGMDRWRMGWLGRSLERLRQAGCAILVATHDAAFVAEYASRAVLLAAGRIAAAGDPLEVLRTDPAFAAALTRWRAMREAAASRDNLGVRVEVQPIEDSNADD
jgi:energy-coupling factor transport system ATP-binding protein